jgi:hypothetical protein
LTGIVVAALLFIKQGFELGSFARGLAAAFLQARVQGRQALPAARLRRRVRGRLDTLSGCESTS